jgi:pimeloyl-ACP methyl ester carboxylesterase
VQALSPAERARTHVLLVAYRLVGPTSFIQEGVADVLLSARTRAGLRNAVVSISLHRPDLAATLPRISAPTLFITGDEHKGWTPRQATAASLRLSAGACAVVPDAAYLPPLEAPRETAR